MPRIVIFVLIHRHKPVDLIKKDGVNDNMCSVSRYSILHDLLMLGMSSMNVAISTTACLLVTSFAWIWYRPVLGGFLLIGAAVPFLCPTFQLYRGDHRENRYQRL
jgi:hypothetical protein